MATQSLSAQLSAKRSAMMINALESVALRLFDERGFENVTVDDIAAEAGISARTFYRYFPAKEDVFQVRIDQRTQAMRVALADRPVDEPPLSSVRTALTEAVSAEEALLIRRWTSVLAVTPSVMNGVLGGIHLKSYRLIAEFLGSRLGLPSDDLVPTTLAAAVGGVIQAAQSSWFHEGGDLTERVSQALGVLERGIGSTASTKTRSTDAPAVPDSDKIGTI